MINYPDTWSKKGNANSIVFLCPKEGENDFFQENVNVMLQDLSQQQLNLAVLPADKQLIKDAQKVLDLYYNNEKDPVNN